MAERAIFLDRDNTIIDNDGYLGDPSKVKLLPGAGTAIAGLRRLGYKIIVVSNQSGVARGMFSEADVESVNQEMCKQLKDQAGATIDASYYCPYHPEAKIDEYRVDHDWRKPKPGMLKQASEDFKIELQQSWMIGDQPRDIAAGAAAGCRTILLRDPEHPASDSEVGGSGVSPNFIVRTLADAARIISREGRGLLRPPPAVVSAPEPEAAPATPQAMVEVPPVAVSAPIVAAAPVVAAAPIAAAAPAAVAVAAISESPPAPHGEDPSIAMRIAEIVSRSQSGGKTEKLLEELIQQLRHQQRQNDYQGEFSLATFGAVLLQCAAVGVMIVGIVGTLQSGSVTGEPHQLLAVARSHTWILLGIGLQAIVLALVLASRKK